MTVDKDCQTNFLDHNEFSIEFRFGTLKGTFELLQISERSFMLRKFRDHNKINRQINEQSRYYKNKIKIPTDEECNKLEILQREYERNVEIYSKRLNKIKFYNKNRWDLNSSQADLTENEVFNNEYFSNTFSMNKDGLNFSFNEMNDTVDFLDQNLNNSNQKKKLQPTNKSFSCQNLGVQNSNLHLNVENSNNNNNFNKKGQFQKKNGPKFFNESESLSPEIDNLDAKIEDNESFLNKENEIYDKASILPTTDEGEKSETCSIGSNFMKRINSNPKLINIGNMKIPKMNAITNKLISGSLKKSFSTKDIKFSWNQLGDNMSLRSFK